MSGPRAAWAALALVLACAAPQAAAAQGTVLQLSNGPNNRSDIRVRIGGADEKSLVGRTVPVQPANGQAGLRVYVTLHSPSGKYQDLHSWYLDAARLRSAAQRNGGRPISFVLTAQTTEKCTRGTVVRVRETYLGYRQRVAAWLQAADGADSPPVPEPTLVDLALISAAMAAACRLDLAPDSPENARMASEVTLGIYRLLIGKGYSFRRDGGPAWTFGSSLGG